MMISMRVIFLTAGLLALICVTPGIRAEEKTVSAYQLSYEEQEAGTGSYATQYIVSDRFLRINDLSDKDGFILYDDTIKTIYSVSHLDRRTLVMKQSEFKSIDMTRLVEISYQALDNAPLISGRSVYSYRVNTISKDKTLCVDIQLAEGLLPQVTKVLQHYKEVVAANQATNLHKTPDEFQTPCFMADQIYDTGEYYTKGLPILEWHSNNSRKTLLNFEKIEVDPDIFIKPEAYTEFSVP